MANLLDRFRENSVGSESKISDYFQTIYPSGDFKRVSDINVILNSWNNILLTPLRSYTFDPEYGSELIKMIFEPADEETKEKIIDEIHYRLMMYDSRAEIEQINVQFLSNKKGFTFDIYVKYGQERSKLSATIDENLYFSLERK